MNEKISQLLKNLNSYFHKSNPEMNERERVFSRVVKLNEEVGELCEAILSEYDKNQRVKDTVTDIDAELADVMICILLLAQDREKDVWQGVESKLEKISKKFNL